MLEALENGVKGGRWYSLMDKVWNPNHLQLGAWQVIRNDGAPGVDHRSCEQLEKELDSEVELLGRRLREGTYQPEAVKRVWIEKPGRAEKRPLGIPTVRDRVVQASLRNVIEPIFEAEFVEHSYGFRPGRGAQQAVERVEGLLKEGHSWVVDADIQGYFDTIPQERLMALVKQRISDGRVLALVEAFLAQGVMESGRGWQPTVKGTPQGAVLSPLLANVYLHPLDLLAQSQGWRMTRYADDFILQCTSQEAAQEALKQIREWMEAAGLTLHPEKTRIVDARAPGGFDFLGWHFERGLKWPREKSVARFKEVLREETPRNSGQSLETIIGRLNRRIRGWARYFQGGVKNVYERLDRWLRGRLRSLLRRRAKRKGRGRGLDHQRYPNAYFAKHGLIPLASAGVARTSPAVCG
ncbi:MAG: group II intron reverse transcriptase/maturase [Verrucomicrobiae bacterium]|nr:group II intron reverse transcriptase/maturase [Verrucomicrobiae bacterium]